MWLKNVYNVIRYGETKPNAFVGEEMGTTSDSLLRAWLLAPYDPDTLIQKKTIKIYETMANDEQIDICLTALKIMRLAAGWQVEPGDQSPSAKQQAAFVEWNLKQVLGGFKDDLFELMDGMAMGWALSEKIWDIVPDGEYAGKIGLKALKSKPVTEYNIVTDKFLNIDPMGVMRVTAPDLRERYPTDKFVIYSFRKKYERVYGRSTLRGLYDLWYLKSVLKRSMGVYLERFGVPFTVGTYPKGTPLPKQNELLSVLKKMKIDGVSVVPDGIGIDFKEATGKGAELILLVLEHIDKQIAKKILGQTLTTEQGDRGSQSLGKVHFDVLAMYLKEMGEDLADNAINPQIVKDLIDFNFPNVTVYPKWKFNPIEEKAVGDMATSFLAAVNAGVIKPTEDDEKYLRDIMGAPERTEESVLLKMPPKVVPPPFGAQPPPPPAAGNDKTPEKLAEIPAALFTGVRRRTLLPYEKRVDFAEAKRTIEDTGVKSIVADLTPVLKDSVDRLMRQVQRAKILENKDSGAVKDLELHGLSDMRRVVTDGLIRVARFAKRGAQNELSVAKGRKDLVDTGFGLTPDDVLKYFKDKAFTITGDISNVMLSKAKNAILQGIRNGQSYRDMVDSLDSVLGDYVSNTGQEDDAGGRLETIVRTNVSDAFNSTRKAEFVDNSDFVQGLMVSAILDDRVRPNHAWMDGKIYRTPNSIWDEWTPPNGYNCRCILVPVTTADGWDGTEDDPPPPSITPDPGFKDIG